MANVITALAETDITQTEHKTDIGATNQIPDLEERFTACVEEMNALEQEIDAISGGDSSSYSLVLRNMVRVIEQMLNNKYSAARYKSDFYTNYSSLSVCFSDMQVMPLDIDQIILSAPGEEDAYEEEGWLRSFFHKMKFAIIRFFNSFSDDYNSISGDVESEGKEKLTLWVNWGQDQARVLNALIQTDFSKQYDIPVEVQVVNASVVQAILSGNGPDVVLHQARTEPVNLAMRGALYDLTQFEDYEDVLQDFTEDAALPYYYKDGLYALPDQQTPDLFFIEYSINDYYTRRSSETTTTRYDRSASQFETIVREIKEVNPECDIVTVLVADNSTMQQAKQGILHTEAQAHEDISIAYNMPSLKFGSAIANKVENLYYDNGIASDAWKENFADIVHPTSKGYAEYYKCIAEFMNNSLLCAEYVETELPELAVAVQSKTLFDGNRTVMDMTADLFAQSTGSGFVLNPNDSKYEFKGSISAANAGSTFTYSFNGTETSILTNKTSASKFTVKIDGENYTPSAGSLSHNPITLAKSLTEGHHTVEITTVDADTTIYAIFTHDTSATTKQGAAVETEHKKAALTLPSGSYTIKYYEKATVSEIPKPVAEGLTFTHWCDESGKIMHDEDALQAGMKLKARFWVQGMNINPDVNDDGYMNEKDTQLLREILVGASNIMYFDVNCDNQCDVKDLVALKKFLTDIWQRDNNYSVNDL